MSQMSSPPDSMVPAAAPAEKVNLAYHAIIGVATGMVAAFTAFAWPAAIVVGYVVGRDQVDRMHGIRNRPAVNLLRALVVVIGFGAMLFLGAILGGLIALLIVALIAFSERIAGNTSPTDQGIARILTIVVGVGVWFLLFGVLKLNIDLNIGG